MNLSSIFNILLFFWVSISNINIHLFFFILTVHQISQIWETTKIEHYLMRFFISFISLVEKVFPLHTAFYELQQILPLGA